MHIGLIGCGNMGRGMAHQLCAEGHPLTCFDPTPEAAQAVQAMGATLAVTPAELARTCDVILLSLPNARVVENVVRGICDTIRPGAILLDTSTSEPGTSQAMAALGATHGFAFVDGPVSGGPAAAHAGTMTMLLGGEPRAIDTLRPVLDVLTAKTVIVGGSGAGHAAKIANNMLCAANLVLVAEAVRLGEAAGVRAEDLLEGINAGSGRSGVSEVNFPKWILNGAFDSGFTMGLMRKDVGLALALAEENDVPISGFETLADIWLNRAGDIPDGADFNEITKFAGKAADD